MVNSVCWVLQLQSPPLQQPVRFTLPLLAPNAKLETQMKLTLNAARNAANLHPRAYCLRELLSLQSLSFVVV